MTVRSEIESKIKKIKDLKKQLVALEEEIKPLTRSVQMTPSGTFFVCLPKNWCKKNGIDKGSLVIISQQEDCLIVVP